MEREATAQAAVFDDGELDDVREVLRDVGVTLAPEASKTEAGLDSGISLIFTTPRYALALLGRGGAPGGGRPFTVVCYASGSRTLRRLLDQARPDFVFRQPVNRCALRLLVQHALYEGPEHRRHPRVAIGAPVTFRVGWRRHKATLAQLSLRGCGLVAAAPLEVDTRLRLALPRDLTDRGTLSLAGRVVASGGPESSAGGCEISVAFEALGNRARSVLRQVMQARAVGAAPLPPAGGRAGASAGRKGKAAPGPAKTAKGEIRVERRGAPRRHYRQKILATGAVESRALIACDLSPGGMRVRPDPALALGDELKLALYATEELSPVMVKAVVARDDGDEGWLLRFRRMPRSASARLEQILESLPEKGSAGGAGVLVSEVLERS